MAMFDRVFVVLIFISQLQSFTAQIIKSPIQTPVDTFTLLPSINISDLDLPQQIE